MEPTKPGPGSRVITVYREQRKIKFSLTIFFSESIAPTKAAPGSLERALRALQAHICLSRSDQ
ncbi:hypothetical protein V1477_017774 [Vespula maculifrons]|uniref:Uncharacterized protein n=1 Tax=Vespula maculifrons TaxID=7453 RepID=A0ABD2B0E9_VESMC